MLIQTYDTFDNLARRLETDLADLFGGAGTGSSARDGWLIPAVEVLRADSEIVVRVELPGVDPDSVDVTVDGTTLRVRAERRVPATEQGEYLRKEFAYGTYEWEIELPVGIDPEKLSARYEGGILEVRVPTTAEKPVKVPVEIGSGEARALQAAS